MTRQRACWPVEILTRHLRREAGGFTVVELIIAMVVFAIGTSAAAAMFIGSLQTSVVAKLDTEAKSLTQQRIEEMRNLPFHVDQSAQSNTSGKVDLLDWYFPNLTAAPPVNATQLTASTGYVAPGATGSTYRLSTEPSSGAFYRSAFPQAYGQPKYRQYVDVQFLGPTGLPVTPSSTLNAAVAGADYAAADQVGVTVTTVWTAGQVTKSYRQFTQIAQATPAPNVVTAQGRMTPVTLQSNVDPLTRLQLQLGDISLTGASKRGISATARAASVVATLSTPQEVDGALLSAYGPPTVTASSASLGQGFLANPSAPGNLATWGNTAVNNVGVSTANGLPNAGSATLPITTSVGSEGSGSYGATFDTGGSYMSRLQLISGVPLVFSDNSSPATSQGYLYSSAPGAGHNVKVDLSGTTTTYHFLATSWAPSGILNVTLTSDHLVCQSTGSSTATLTYTASVAYYNGAGYTTVNLNNTDANDPLAAQANLLWHPTSWPTTVPSGAVRVWNNPDPTQPDLFLGDYISSLSSLTSGDIAAAPQQDNGGQGITASYAGVVQVATQPLLFQADGVTPEPTSSVGLWLGAANCEAGDYR